MKKVVLILFIFLCLNLTQSKSPIKHVVVLMLENRSFDHMCGYLKQTYNSSILGLTGKESNPVNPSDPNSKQNVKVNDQAPYVDPDPSHSIDGTTLQVFGGLSQNVSVAPMNGFVASAIQHNITETSVMSCFNEKSVPTISTLAREFGLFDQWFSDVPGPTEVNRMYVQSATSHGAGTNDPLQLALGYPQRTIYHNLHQQNLSFDIFFTDFPTAFFQRDLRYPPYLERFHLIGEFEKYVNEGKLANYTFLEPSYFTVDPKYPANDQHPSHDVAEGEYLMQKVYSILRNGPSWNETALLITYDEHGGFFDHMPTPLKDIPNPDGLNSKDPNFDFNRLGVRIPSVLISPWVEKGAIFGKGHGPQPTSEYSHSSVPSTLKKLFDLDSDFLTKRDQWASTFEKAFESRSTPRTDCPVNVPSPPHGSLRSRHLKMLEHQQSPNDLQMGFVHVSQFLSRRGETLSPLPLLKTERDAGVFVMSQLEKHFKGRISFPQLKV